jgi:hypothetical protein
MHVLKNHIPAGAIGLTIILTDLPKPAPQLRRTSRRDVQRDTVPVLKGRRVVRTSPVLPRGDQSNKVLIHAIGRSKGQIACITKHPLVPDPRYRVYRHAEAVLNDATNHEDPLFIRLHSAIGNPND